MIWCARPVNKKWHSIAIFVVYLFDCAFYTLSHFKRRFYIVKDYQ